jgi:hypothetical protein
MKWYDGHLSFNLDRKQSNQDVKKHRDYSCYFIMNLISADVRTTTDLEVVEVLVTNLDLSISSVFYARNSS